MGRGRAALEDAEGAGDLRIAAGRRDRHVSSGISLEVGIDRAVGIGKTELGVGRVEDVETTVGAGGADADVAGIPDRHRCHQRIFRAPCSGIVYRESDMTIWTGTIEGV